MQSQVPVPNAPGTSTWQLLMKSCQTSFPVMFPVPRSACKHNEQGQLLPQNIFTLCSHRTGRENQTLQACFNISMMCFAVPNHGSMGCPRACAAALGLFHVHTMGFCCFPLPVCLFPCRALALPSPPFLPPAS